MPQVCTASHPNTDMRVHAHPLTSVCRHTCVHLGTLAHLPTCSYPEEHTPALGASGAAEQGCGQF